MICLSCLIYQTIELLNEYLLGKTIVSLQVKILEEESLPAITICIESWLSMDQISKLTNYSTKYKNYLRIYEDFINITTTMPTDSEENITRLKSDIRTLYKEAQNELLKYSSLNKIMTEFGIKLRDAQGYVSGIRMINSSFAEIDKFETEIVPIESTMYIPTRLFKCITYFTQLQPIWRHVRLKLPRIFVTMLFPYKSMPKPYLTGYKYLLAIHSPNSLPHFENMRIIDPDTINEISFSQVKTQLLGEGYDTNCYDYDLDYNHVNFNMRSDCITECILKSSGRINNENYCKVCPYPIRKENFRIEKLIDQCKLDFRNYFPYDSTIEFICNKNCRMDCDFNYYLWEQKTTNMPRVKKENIRLEYSFEGRTRYFISIKHNHFPDILIEYLPQTTFLSFVCNFGGILGMYLGLSILTIFTGITDIFIKINNRYELKKFFQFNKNATIIQNPIIVLRRNVKIFLQEPSRE